MTCNRGRASGMLCLQHISHDAFHIALLTMNSPLLPLRVLFSICCAATVLFAAVSAKAAEPARERWTVESMLKAKVLGDVALAPDGARVVFTVSTPQMDGDRSEWLSHVYLAAADGSNTVQLTRGEKSATEPQFSPDGRWVAFLSPRSGPRANLWRIRVDGGESEQLTDERGGVASFAWSPDGTHLAFLMPDVKSDDEEKAERERRDAYAVGENHRRSRLYLVAAQVDDDGKRRARRLTGGDLHVGGYLGGRNFDWSPDGKSIAFAHQPTPMVDDWRKTDISLIDLATGKISSVVATEAAETQPMFSPDGTRIAYTASEVPPRWAFASRVQLVRPDGKGVEPLAETFDLKPALVGWSADGTSVLVNEARGTVQRLYSVPSDGAAVIEFSSAETMVTHAALSSRRGHVAYVSESPERAPEVFVSAMAVFSPLQVSRVQELPNLPIGKTDVISWKSADGRDIEGLLTYPVGYETGTRVPLVVVIHGGPMGVFTRTCIVARGPYPLAVFAARGFAVLRCNVRGSSGYGKEFRYANHDDWGGGDYRDIMSGVDALIERGIADADRLGVMGWSYGGYMTSWMITQTNRFKAASVGAGITNMVSFTGSTDIAEFLPDYLGSEFWARPERWRALSPLLHVAAVETPTLIQHGDRDARVPIGQGYELHNALKRRGVPVTMVVYPRQGHTLQEPKLQLDAARRNVDWLERWLKPAAK